MDNFNDIDNYFSGTPVVNQQADFERRIMNDAQFAADVAFYLSAKQGIGEQSGVAMTIRFRELFAAHKATADDPKVKSIFRQHAVKFAAAAVFVAVLIGWAVFRQSITPEEQATAYIAKHFTVLSVTMGNKRDSLQDGIRLFNGHSLEQAAAIFGSMSLRDSLAAEPKKYAGIVNLKLKQYDQAIFYFTQLEQLTGLYANPGKFYHALALLQRQGPGDKVQAKGLLQQVVALDLDEKEAARDLLNKW